MSNKQIPYKIYLEEHEMPKAWYNLRADMKNKPAPLLNPDTLKPMTKEELSRALKRPSSVKGTSGTRQMFTTVVASAA